ncbi:hypothetical protein [Leisingera sp. JC11]|uniref:hypothetical protein n=1 Tax=Leisingera sp. JC11 TaxID=3042469 RepID=UPI0034535F78
MRLFKKSFPFVVGLASYFVIKALFFGTVAAREVDPSQLEQALLQTEQGELFHVVKSEFPVEFQAFIQELATVAGQKYANKQQRSLAIQNRSREFTTGLRQKNAHYLKHAPVELLRALQTSKLELMLTTQNDPALCTRFANYGPAGFTESELNTERLSILAEGSVLFFKSVAAGRDHPVQRARATQEDYAAFLTDWSEQPEVTSGMYEALMQNDPTSDEFCASMTSFQRFVTSLNGPSAERVLADLSAEADSN